jgi:alpha-soluble NSF attachment protein
MSEGGKGAEFMAQADAKLKQKWVISNAAKYEAAMELYDKAAAQFKISKQWDDAGEAYVKMAECAEKLGNETEAVAAYTSAGKAYKNGNTKEAIKYFRIAAEMRMAANAFQQAAKLHQEIAGVEEKNLNLKGAIKSYNDAADCFHAEGSVPSENQALLKVAELSATEEDYQRAIMLYEKVAAAALESTLLKYSAKDYFFRAGLCQFVVCAKSDDMKVLEEKLDKYKDQHPAFDGDRSCKLLENCMKAFDDNDVDAFTEHVYTYDKIYKLDNLITSLLLTIKKILRDGVRSEEPLLDDPVDLS